MSGGHYNYLYSTILYTFEGEMEDVLMEEMLKDFCNVLKSLEWYKSDDISREDYLNDIDKFITKWTKADYSAYAKAKRDIVNKLENFIETNL